MADPRPSFIVVVTDDMRDSDWQALPKTWASVANPGTVFPNFFLTTPVCSPSRTSILTGMYPHNHGVTRNDGKDGGFEQFVQKTLGESSLPTVLRQAGYRTGLFGKFMNGIPDEGPIPGGWDQWLAATERAYYRFTANESGKARRFERESEYSTDVFAGAAAAFIRATDAAQPLLLFYSPKAPHGPAIPARRHRGAFKHAHVERSPDFNEGDVSNKPGYIRSSPLLGTSELDTLNRKRLETLIAVDDAVEQLVAVLSETGRLANTYLFVLSDNGYLLGSHRQVKKGVPYRQATQVRMAVTGPAFVDGGIDHRLAANIDVAPTIAALAGVDLPAADGVALLATPRREAVLLQSFGGTPTFRAVRTQRYLYVENDTGERELYDYADDPYELANLLADWEGHTPAPGAESIAADLKSRLRALRGCEGNTCR